MVHYQLDASNGLLQLGAENQQEAIALHNLAQQARQAGYPVKVQDSGSGIRIAFPLTGRQRLTVDCPEHGENVAPYVLVDDNQEPFFIRCARCVASVLDDKVLDVTTNQGTDTGATGVQA